MASFLTLPNELLRHIASSLPLSALLKLRCVKRRLHDVCNDRLVLHNIARNGLFNTTGAAESLILAYSARNRVSMKPEQLEWREGDLLLDRASLQDTSRVAYAVERCIEASLTKHNV